jgi:hypothetical protein
MIMFGMLFAINVAAAMVALAFFIIGLGDGTVTSFNILIWAAMLGVLFSMPWAAWGVRLRGRARLGTLLLLPVAVPAVAAGALILVMIAGSPDWR